MHPCMERPDQKLSWEEIRKRLLDEYPQLKEEDLIYEAGKEEALLERLRQKLGKTKEEINYWLHLMG